VKALILGAGGQVGRALAATAPPGAALVALDRTGCDIADRNAVEQAIGAAAPDLVVNAAAYTAVDRAESEPEAAERLNAQAPGWIAAASRAAGARFVHISTDFVFDGRAGSPYRPDAATNPQSVYGRTKRDGELAVLAACPDALIVRTAWVYAAAGGNFVNTMLRLMAQRDRLTVVADQIGTPTFAASLAAALWTLAQGKARGIHHYTDAGAASWYDFAVAVHEEGQAAGLLDRPVDIVPIPTSDYPTPAHRPAFSVLDKSATWAAMGRPAPHWRSNLRICLKESSRHG
jgi:dTDP-4-dehydrorhamnose reductase